MKNHEIDYKLYGEELQYVEIELDPGETAVAESGSFMKMELKWQLFLAMAVDKVPADSWEKS